MCAAIEMKSAPGAQLLCFSREETEKARRIALNRVMQEWQTAHGQARNLASGAFYAGDPLFAQHYLQRLQQVAPADLTRAAKTYLMPRRTDPRRPAPAGRGNRAG